MGLLSTLGWGGAGNDGILGSLVKLKQLERTDAMDAYRTALLGKMMRQEEDNQRAAGIIQNLPTERQTEVQMLPQDPTGTMDGGGYAPPLVPRLLSTPYAPHEINQMRADALNKAGYFTQAKPFQERADTEGNKIAENWKYAYSEALKNPDNQQAIKELEGRRDSDPYLSRVMPTGVSLAGGGPQFPKQTDEAHLLYTANYHPDPTKREQATTVLQGIKQNKIDIDAARRNAEASQLSPGALRTEATKYLVTGNITGMRGTADKVAIMNAKDELMSELGISPEDATAIQASYKADAQALVTMRKREAMTSQAEGQANNNAKELINRSNLYTRSNYPAPNKAIGWFAENLGSKKVQEDVGRYKVALLAFSREYMRVTTGGAMSAAELSIGAQNMADKLLNSSDSWSTLQAKVEQAQIEMKNTIKSHRDEVSAVMGRIQNPLGYVTGDFTKKPQVPTQSGTGNGIENNPLNIKLGPATQKWVDQGMATIGRDATDGGKFLNFSSKDAGLNAAHDLLFGNGKYTSLNVDQAMRKWSNNGYGGEIASSLANKPISSLNAIEREAIIQAMAQREGNPLQSKGNGNRTVVKKFKSKSTGKTKLVYSDGTEEIS